MILKRSIQNARILNFCEASLGWCRGDGGKGGSDLADGYFGVVWNYPGDQDYKRDCLNLANTNETEPCAHGLSTLSS